MTDTQKQQLQSSFKEFITDYHNEGMYYEIKSFLSEYISDFCEWYEDDEMFYEAKETLCNLTGGLVWSD